MRQDSGCKALCTTTVPAADAGFINERIREDYVLNWLIDGLPAAELKVDNRTGESFYDLGFNLGDDEGEQRTKMPAFNNHYEIQLQ